MAEPSPLALAKSSGADQLPQLTAKLMAICKAEATQYADIIDPKIVLARIKEAGAILKKEPTLVELSPGPEIKEVFVVSGAAPAAGGAMMTSVARIRAGGGRLCPALQPAFAATPQVGDTHGQFPDMTKM